MKRRLFPFALLLSVVLLSSVLISSSAGQGPLSSVVDDSDGAPGFVRDGQSDPEQPAFWGYTGIGYAGNAFYTGNSINSTPHNWATWAATGVVGTLDVQVAIPPFRRLTHGATYVITHAEGQTSVVIDQAASAGQVVSLGTFTFDGTGSVYLNDVVSESGGTFLSHIVFDAVSFGSLDVTPPLIEEVKAYTDQGIFRIQAKVTDAGSGVGVVILELNGVAYPMSLGSGDTYYVSVPYTKNSKLKYSIRAVDNVGNEATWDPIKGYVARGGFYRGLGVPRGYYCPELTCPGLKTNTGGNRLNSHLSGDPINPQNGNLLERDYLVSLPGRPAIDLYITYNSLSARPSIFGENWTHSYNYHVLEMDNPDFQGAFVQYPDGQVVKFIGSNFQAEPGYYETLVKQGDEYLLTFKDRTKVTFNALGDLIRWEDANGNGLTFSYGATAPYTLLSQITALQADGGREITLEYNDQGFVEAINAPEGKTITLGYDAGTDDLISMINGRGGETKFTYQDHLMTAKISPKGHPSFTNAFDGQKRVATQTAGATFKHTYAYQSKKTVVTDANAKTTTYIYNNDDLVQELIDANGKAIKYEYTPNKELKKLTDRDNATYEYRYDSQGNQIYEKDPLGYEIIRTFNQTFGKPEFEQYKKSDHITRWRYDGSGNLLEIINAKTDSSTFAYNGYGQLTLARDFNQNPTTYDYNKYGDVETITDAKQNPQTFAYDGLGRMVAYTDANRAIYTYTYDGNDNPINVFGPLLYHLGFGYDANDNNITEIDANGNPIHYTFDTSERLTEIRDQEDHPTTFTYGLMNELLTETDAEGRITTYEYDAVYNPITLVAAAKTPDAAMTRYTYSGMRDPLTMTDPEGRVTRYEYDPRHQLTKEIRNATANPADSENNVTTAFEYSPTGALERVTDPNGHAISYTLDQLDQITDEIDAETQHTHYVYDAQGNLTERKNPRRYSTVYGYDVLNRLETIRDARQGLVMNTYDANSNLVFIKDPNGVVTKYGYDALNRTTQRVDNFVNHGPNDAKTNVTMKYGYSTGGDLLAVTNPRHFTTSFRYDRAHHPIKIIDAYDKVAELTYDKVYNLTGITDRNTHVTSHVYDNLNRVVQSINPEQHSESFVYDRIGNLIRFTNARQKVFTTAYDPLNRTKTATDPYQKAKHYTYDAVGNPLTLTDENGHTDRFSYDKVNRLRQSFDAEQNLTEYRYDENGNTVKVIDGETNPTDYAYDELDRLIATVNAENEREQYEYDALTNTTKRIEADGTAHTYAYDSLYRLTDVVNNFKVQQPRGNDVNVSTHYDYDANSNLTKSTDPRSFATTFDYDRLDRLAKETNPLSNTWDYGYDFEGNLTQRIDANRAVTSYRYYPDDMLAEISYPTYRVNYDYSETNFPVEMRDNLGTTAWVYDDLDRLTAQRDPFSRPLAYGYDFVGNVTSLTYPDGRSMSHAYLKNDWLRVSTSSDGDSVTYTRNKVGAPTHTERSNASYSDVVYDKVYRIRQIGDNQRGSGNHLISKFNYTYNPIGHITTEKATYGWRQPSVVNTVYGYDGMHRLNKASSDDGQSSTYAYDAAGNRTSLLEQLRQGIETWTSEYNPANQLAKVLIDSPLPPRDLTLLYTYDNNGNRIDEYARDNTGIDRGVAYTYDVENRLLRAQDYQVGGNSALPGPAKPQPKATITPTPQWPTNTRPRNELAHTDYAYDGNGRRLVQTYFSGNSIPGKRTEFTFDRLDPVVEYSMWNGQRNNLYRNSAQDLLFFQEFKSEQDPKGTLYTYHYDGRGNIAATTKHRAQSDHTYRYDEYGMILPENGSLVSNRREGNAAAWGAPHNQYTLAQKQYDPHTSLGYFGYRFYDLQVGVWLTQDIYRGDIFNPQSLQRYMYNYDSPVNYIDKDGRFAWAVVGIIAMAVIDKGLDIWDYYQVQKIIDDPKSTETEKSNARDEQGLIITMEMTEPEEVYGGLSLPIDNVVRFIVGSTKNKTTKKAAQIVTENIIETASGKKCTIGNKISNQMTKRGWNKDLIQDAIENPSQKVQWKDTRHLDNGPQINDPATAYLRKDGSYVVINDKNGDIVQISDRNNSSWKYPWDEK